MGSNDNILLGFSLIITFLVILPIVLLFGLIFEVPFSSLSIMISIISIGLYISSTTLYDLGLGFNKPKLVIIGFFLGLPSCILSLVTISLTFKNIDLALLITLYRLSWCPLDGQIRFTILGGFEGGFVGFMPPFWVGIIIFLNIALAILCVIFGFIVLQRRKKLLFSRGNF